MVFLEERTRYLSCGEVFLKDRVFSKERHSASRDRSDDPSRVQIPLLSQSEKTASFRKNFKSKRRISKNKNGFYLFGFIFRTIQESLSCRGRLYAEDVYMQNCICFLQKSFIKRDHFHYGGNDSQHLLSLAIWEIIKP